MYRQFFEKYDPSGKLTFDNVKFRSGAEHTLDFGIYVNQDNNGVVQSFREAGLLNPDGSNIFKDNRQIYFHVGDDRGDPFHKVVFHPFDGYPAFYNGVTGYGNLFVTKIISADFVTRIGHIIVNDEIQKDISEKRTVPEKAAIGRIGDIGTGSREHTHFEIVSQYEKSEICEEIIERKKIKEVDLLERILVSKDINRTIKKQAEDWCNARQVYNFYNTRVQRRNGFSSKEIQTKICTYYNSRLLFGM